MSTVTDLPAYRLWSQLSGSQSSGDQSSENPRSGTRVESVELPAKIGRYRIESLLGSGGFGRVYLAMDEQLDRQVAIKVPHAKVAATEELIVLIQSEAKTVASLDHPNIVPIYDVGSTEQFPVYLVAKLIHGQNLARLSLKCSCPAEAVGWTIQIADALAYAHDKSVVHRDVKPHNILIDGNRNACLTDFGLAQRGTDKRSMNLHAGTPAYMSPEQREARPSIDSRTDIYSLGCVLVELLLDVYDIHHPRDLANALSKLRAIVPAELVSICERATAEKTEDRFQHAAEMAQSLRQYSVLQGWTNPPTTLPAPLTQATKTTQIISASPAVQVEQRKRSGPLASWRPWLILGALAAIAGLGAHYWQNNKHQQSEKSELDAYLSAPPHEISSRLIGLRNPSTLVLDRLNAASLSNNNSIRLRAQLALLGQRPGLLEAVAQAMCDAPVELAAVIAQELAPHGQRIRDMLLNELRDETQTLCRRLNASSFLAQYLTTDPMWNDPELVDCVVRLLLQDDLSNLPAHADAHRQQKTRLVAHLKARVVREEDRSTASLIRVYEVWNAIAEEDCLDYLVECPVEMADRAIDRLKGNPKAMDALREVLHTLPEQPDHPGSAAVHRRRFMAAYALHRLGSTDEFWQLWRHSPYPDLTTVSTFAVADSPVTLSMIADRLVERDLLEPVLEAPSTVDDQLFSARLSERRQLLHAFFRSVRWQSIDKHRLDKIFAKLRKLIVHEADAGMQAHVYWMLKGATRSKRWHLEEWFPKDEVRASNSKRSWSLNSLDMTMVHISSAPDIGHNYCLSQREIEVRLFEQFLQDNQLRSQPVSIDDYDPIRFKPQVEVSWYDCAAFCNWLSRREGLEECYQPNADGQFAAGMRIKPDWAKLNGYRLPTSAEWVYGCRAGAKTLYSSGDLERYIFGYGWSKDSTKELVPTGHLPPNALGLFDMHGNASEWVLDDSSAPEPTMIVDSIKRICRGGDFQSSLRDAACDRIKARPAVAREANLGFRIARTLP
ncbi:MAG: SUMF1/EgtB/PvdO family nonheme iron enzyme [Pirellulaceae bacterium]|nr:SUMF1/EgtB/PvdO family nonheme iron enzyme [Pirellulaceae bacterium]